MFLRVVKQQRASFRKAQLLFFDKSPRMKWVVICSRFVAVEIIEYAPQALIYGTVFCVQIVWNSKMVLQPNIGDLYFLQKKRKDDAEEAHGGTTTGAGACCPCHRRGGGGASCSAGDSPDKLPRSFPRFVWRKFFGQEGGDGEWEGL